MGKIINWNASDNPYMFQIFKTFVHQTEKNEFYVDGTWIQENPGVMVDFRNISHSYEIFEIFGNYWGSWNSTPTYKEMYHVAKAWEEKYGAEIVEIGYDYVNFKLGKELSEEEIDILFEEIKELNAEANCRGGFENLRNIIKESNKFGVWWD